MMRVYSLLLVLLLGLPVLWGQDNPIQSFQNANELYENASYKEAISIYESLLEKDYVSDDLHYNLANSYFKTKQIALAILHYEKALKINPSNQNAAYNLKLANQKTVDKIEAIPDLFIYRWWRAIYHLCSVDQWAYLTIVFFLLFSAGLSAYFLLNQLALRKVSFYLGISSLVIGLLCWSLASQQKSNMLTSDSAIIMQASVNIVSAPSEGSSQLFVLHEGTKVAIKEKNEEWLRVSLPNGNEGWIQQSALASI
jgi:tetratricopeptide (TPR) repeat protein